jgi:hypothetical protein
VTGDSEREPVTILQKLQSARVKKNIELRGISVKDGKYVNTSTTDIENFSKTLNALSSLQFIVEIVRKKEVNAHEQR